MTIKSSGSISIGDVNTELSLARTTNKNLGNSDVRTLLQKPSGAVPLSAAYGKSNIKIGFKLTSAFYSGFVGLSYGWAKGSYGSVDQDPARISLNNSCEITSLAYWDANGYGGATLTQNIGNTITIGINGVNYVFTLDSQDGFGVYYVHNFSYSNPLPVGGPYNITFP